MRVRVLGVILSLLAGALYSPAVTAVEDGQATPVGWLCQLAFERGVEVGTADPARFDAAIGACTSADEFAAAVTTEPYALGGIDPVELLVARCSDPDAGLDRYQACGSVADLIAQAAPDPSAGAATQPSDRVVIDDETGGLRFDRSDPLYVPVPPGIKARIPGAWQVKYFNVRGNDLKQLDRSIARQSRKVCGDHAWGCVTNRRVAIPKGRTVSNGERCWVDTVSWKPYRPIVWMPRWKTDVLVHQDILRWWTAELARTAAHEARHIEIDLEYRDWIADRVVKGRRCGAVDKSFAKFERKLEKAHRQFHHAEGLREEIEWPYVPSGERQSVER